MPACPNCGQELEVVDINENCVTMACGFCDLGGKEHIEYVREFICWNCQIYQQAGEDRRSEIPGMGHHCCSCGKDLTEYYDPYYNWRIQNAALCYR